MTKWITLTQAAAQIADCIETNDEWLFLLNTQKEIIPLLRLVIYELANVIKKGESRDIFISISTGKPVLAVAEEMGMTYNKVARIYENTVREIWRKNVGRKNWRDEKAELLQNLRQTKKKLSDLEKVVCQQRTKEKNSFYE